MEAAFNVFPQCCVVRHSHRQSIHTYRSLLYQNLVLVSAIRPHCLGNFEKPVGVIEWKVVATYPFPDGCWQFEDIETFPLMGRVNFGEKGSF